MSLFIAYPQRVIDGDTFVAIIELQPFVKGVIETRVRIAGINAPELHGATKEAGLAAKTWLEERLHGVAYVSLFAHGEDSFGRLLADVSVGGVDFGPSVGREMLDLGLAVPFKAS